MNIKTRQFSFKVKSGEISASLITPPTTNARMAVVLPGAAYSCKQPLLYYSTQMLLKNQFKVLTINKLYAEDPQWLALTKTGDALRAVEEDSIHLFQQITETFLEIDTVLARSLGTYALACALEKGVVAPRHIIWQCPSLNHKWNALKDCKARSLGIIGTHDERYATAQPYLPKDRLIIDDADHALEFSDPVKTIDILKQVIRTTEEWLLSPLETPIDTTLTDHTLSLSYEERIETHQSALQLVRDLQEAGKELHARQPKSLT